MLCKLTLYRQYATNLQPLRTTLQRAGATVIKIPRHQQIRVTDNLKPLVVLPCDLFNFHRNIQQDWQLFAAESDA